MSRTNHIEGEGLLNELIQQLRFHSSATIFLHEAIGEKIGLNATDHKCLEIIAREGKVTAGELAAKSGLTTGAITGVIDRLEKTGYVRRIRDSSDRRRLLVELIPENMEKISHIFQDLAQESAGFLSRYSEGELQTIIKFLKNSTAFAADYAKTLKKTK
ncbi:MarR family winged helix-turn-helix transcriptional regulator [Bacillus paralicheniformis]|uniref:HTH-type transcriptional regulator MhqR n=2 Tax=Bacillus paralicheniformis TaxID=1648923 RepID=A0A7Z1B2Y2_9BACI|nr:MarR family transcriptional regulator [Bacillus paralicheniformis]POO76958.1 MarR family transcriptional regulator [Bacillus sp. MBGLi97]MBL7474937.1 MarR family transcriptional regulator [Bacillus paralicheniformis]MBX9434612.1 MarR family transcriptional regulator [Bacillus paralicheniformis]MCW4367110.1 MarR family transcriptional regulator [Bacillus paralicheniformis]MED1220881.1 MarR family transcriptional regulator [Bacillus paralicheniformis]